MSVTLTDCRSPVGVTVGLIDAIISMARVLRDRDLNAPEIQEALKDLQSDNDVLALLTVEPISCDLCGVELDNPAHFSGVLGGEVNQHIHACPECVEKYKLKWIDFDLLKRLNLSEAPGGKAASIQSRLE